MKLLLFTSTILLLIISPYAQAAELVAWKSYLAGIMGIAAIGGYILSMRNEKAEGRMAKIILGGLYFWVITFAELIVLATIYHFTG
ncbi:MAG: hypothetical protein ACJAS9_000786 [Polaribacter sp.]